MYSISDILKYVTHSLFIPSPIVTQLVHHLTFGREWPYVAVHARTGGDVSEGDLPRFAAMAENYTVVTASLLDCVMKRKKGGVRRIYLASDSVEFKKNFIHIATNQYGIDVKTLKEKAVHTGKRSNKDRDDDDEVEHNESIVERNCKGFLNAFVDIAAMGRAEFIVSTSSGFSNMAFFIGMEPRSLYVGYSSDPGERSCRLTYGDRTTRRKRYHNRSVRVLSHVS